MSDLKDSIKKAYSEAAKSGKCLCSTNAYEGMDLSYVPKEVIDASQGCSSPLGAAAGFIKEGSSILDLGCGSGLDVYIASKLVGKSGKAVGVDFTKDQIDIAIRNKGQLEESLGFGNTEFYEEDCEDLSLGSDLFDIVISNCSLNLSEHKLRILTEVFRVLKPGGFFFISDIYSLSPVPNYIKNDRDLIERCIGGSEELSEITKKARRAGFASIRATNPGSYINVDGVGFVSLTLEGAKPSEAQSRPKDAFASLVGPMLSVKTGFGTTFKRGLPQRVTPEIAETLMSPAYKDFFIIANDDSRVKTIGVMPEDTPCVYLGHYASLLGPFQEAEDDDSHHYYLGKPLEICEKTKAVLSDPKYNGLFFIEDRANGRKISANEIDCGDECDCDKE